MDNESVIQSFCVQATPVQPRYDVSDSLPSHRFVLWPILTAAAEARVIGRVCDPEVKAVLAPISKPTRGGFELDLSKDVLRGSERLWNVKAWARGAIVLACPPEKLALGGVFQYCEGPWIWSSRNQMLKGTPMGALEYAEGIARGGLFAFLLSASNGIEWLDVFPPPHAWVSAFAEAEGSCRKFKRFIEHNPGSVDEIIVDRPPYAQDPWAMGTPE